MSLHKDHDMTIAANAAAVRLHKKLILTAILFRTSEINLWIMYIQKIEK